MNPIKSFANQVMELRAKKLEVELEVNKALSAKEIAQKDATQAIENVEAIRKDITELNDVLSSILDNCSSIKDNSKDIIIEYLETIRYAGDIVNSYITTISQLQNKVVEAKNEFEQVKKDQESAWENIRNEVIKSADLKKNLDIYKNRLEKIRDEVAPNVNILV
ncbi:MAG: hypothetical protein DDT19_01685 [Syntrophomonadaceae bacterium]|nr:hypothetical protein [Bacillota bacterium]